tara:strand:- start:746 stop:1336 length:591 start_codon:yes stop_codon:yes gene_type:complete
MKQPPTLREAWLKDIRANWARGPIHVLPWRVAICCGAGFLVALNIEASFFYPRRWDVSVALYAGLLAFNALTMALAWSGIGRVYDSLAAPSFSSFLQHSGVLSTYLFILGFIHGVQTIAALLAIASLGILLVGWIPIWVDRITLALTLGSTLYALWWAYLAARVARDLSWHHATFDSLDEEQIQRIRLAVDNDAAG